MDVSVIYVNYHTSGLIADSLRSLVRLTEGVEYEVIIVDNNTEKDLPDRFSNLFPDMDIRYVMLDDNVGFGRANNAAFRIARGRNLLCLNPDTILLNNAVRMLSDYLDAHSDTAIVGGNLLDSDMKPTLSFRRIRPGILWEINELLHHIPVRAAFGKNIFYNYTDRPLEVGYISGADLMIRSDVASASGGFHPDYFMYYEETDLCNRVSKAGYKITNLPQARIQHLEGKSYADNGFNAARLERSERSRITYYRLNHSSAATRTADWIYRIFLASRAYMKHSVSYRYRLQLLKSLSKRTTP